MKESVISICMGSSCFARGNNRSLEIIRKYIEENGSPAQVVSIKGSLCQGLCSKGPNMLIDGKLFSGVLPENVGDILRLHLAAAGEKQ